MSGVLVNISAVRFAQNLQYTPPKEYAELANAATATHMALGSYKLCGHCVKGELNHGRSNGCCNTCVNLSDAGCLMKTVACASHVCFRMPVLYGETTRPMKRLEGKLFKLIKYPGMPYFDRGYSEDMKYAWTPKDLRKMRRLTQAYTALTNRIKRQNFKPDWDKVLKALEYVPKTGVRA